MCMHSCASVSLRVVVVADKCASSILGALRGRGDRAAGTSQ